MRTNGLRLYATEQFVELYSWILPFPICLVIDLLSCGRNHSQGNGGFDLLLGTITWGKEATVIYGANNESTGFDFYSIPVSASGPGIIKDYRGAMPGSANPHIHYEHVTQLVYGDNGYVVNPATGGAAEHYSYYGVMAADGTLNQPFFVNDGSGGSTAGTIAAFNLTKFSPTGLYIFPNVNGSPRRLVRWGATGLAFNALNYNYSSSASTTSGRILIYSGNLVSTAK